MPSTPKLALRYPAGTDTPDGPGAFLTLATDVENAILANWTGNTPTHTGSFDLSTSTDSYARTAAGRTTVYFRGVFRAATSGQLQIGLVKPAAKPGAVPVLPSGRAFVNHAGNLYEFGIAGSTDGTALLFTYPTAAPQVAYVTNAAPFAWAVGDVFTLTATYES